VRDSGVPYACVLTVFRSKGSSYILNVKSRYMFKHKFEKYMLKDSVKKKQSINNETRVQTAKHGQEHLKLENSTNT